LFSEGLVIVIGKLVIIHGMLFGFQLWHYPNHAYKISDLFCIWTFWI